MLIFLSFFAIRTRGYLKSEIVEPERIIIISQHKTRRTQRVEHCVFGLSHRVARQGVLLLL